MAYFGDDASSFEKTKQAAPLISTYLSFVYHHVEKDDLADDLVNKSIILSVEECVRCGSKQVSVESYSPFNIKNASNEADRNIHTKLTGSPSLLPPKHPQNPLLLPPRFTFASPS